MRSLFVSTLGLSSCLFAATGFSQQTHVAAQKSSSSYASSKFKVPNDDTPPSVAAKLKEEDETLWKYVESQVPAVMDHTGSAAFDVHLKGVQSVLRYWKSPSYLINAGLFHSIYGTEGFQGFTLPLSERPAIQQLIGKKAEEICFWFCMVDRWTLDETVFAWEENSNQETFKLRARPEVGRFDMILSKEEWLDFVELTLADWLEQVEGAAVKPNGLFKWKIGEAYSYRRLAYRKMSEILSVERSDRLETIPKEMLEAVMATESPETKHLVQPRTPPMSDAAAYALEALRAAGEDIPVDMSPQPMEECDSATA